MPVESDRRHLVLGLRLLCAVSRDAGVSTQEVLTGTGVDVDRLADPEADADLVEHVRAVRNALAAGVADGDAALLGLQVGSRINLTHLGLLGFAALASASIRELLTLALRYFSLTNLVVDVALTEADGRALLSLDAHHLPPDVRPYFVARDVAGIVGVVPPFVAPTMLPFLAEIELEMPPEDAPLQALLEGQPLGSVRLGERRLLTLPSRLLDAPLPQADAATRRTCLAQVEASLERRQRRAGVAAQVRSALLARPGEPPALDEVASGLGVHPRTLRRRLDAEGTSYRALLEEIRRTVAVELLVDVGLTVEECARRLGYSETAAFTHAFVRWFGVPPSRYRLG